MINTMHTAEIIISLTKDTQKRNGDVTRRIKRV